MYITTEISIQLKASHSGFYLPADSCHVLFLPGLSEEFVMVGISLVLGETSWNEDNRMGELSWAGKKD